MPIDNRMDPHKRRPAAIRLVEKRQLAAMRVRAARADEDGLDRGLFAQVVCEGGFHGLGVAGEVEAVGARGGGDEGLDFGEGVRRDDVDGLDEWQRGRGRVRVEGGEEEDE